jgi:hypothetical protein
MNDDDGLLPQAGRYGEHVRGGGVSFRCAACGEMAAVVRLVRAGTTVNMGLPWVSRFMTGTVSWSTFGSVAPAGAA